MPRPTGPHSGLVLVDDERGPLPGWALGTPTDQRPPVTVVIVDDHKWMTRVIARAFSDLDDIKVVGQAVGHVDAPRIITATRPQVLLLDILLESCLGFEVARQVLPDVPELRVICFSSFVAPDLVAQAIDTGAWGYVEKIEEYEALPAAIRAVATGQRVFSIEAADIVQALRPEEIPVAAAPLLTELETDVVRLVAKGMSVTEIARELGHRRGTIRAVMERARVKLGFQPVNRRFCVPSRSSRRVARVASVPQR